jgi:hypothetical protein
VDCDANSLEEKDRIQDKIIYGDPLINIHSYAQPVGPVVDST